MGGMKQSTLYKLIVENRMGFANTNCERLQSVLWLKLYALFSKSFLQKVVLFSGVFLVCLLLIVLSYTFNGMIAPAEKRNLPVSKG